MFVYFIQCKGFLNGNINYLADRLSEVQAKSGKGKFHSFYRLFLRRLFHEGLGKNKPRGAEMDVLLGDIPYLNGGLFAVHELEEENPDIDIPDEAFQALFAFFGAYDWHLDDRPLSSGSEINPDVLGYIFEKYINQKQMGAYYTKEDITEYISKNTVVPHLLEQARERCKVAFDGDASVWNLLKADPGRYIYPAVKNGVVDANGALVPETALPDFVQKGMHDPKARMFERRYNLGEAVFHTSTGERGTLPTETWREYVERRTRCLSLGDKLTNGEVRSADDLVTLNLDIRQFMQDVIDTCTGPDLLRAVWQAIVGRVPERANEKFRHGITILDPTCGSGAFLFAALNVLEPLYEACLDRMEGFVEDARKLGKSIDADFSKVLDEVARHPSRRYYIYKTIILHNLFGVDIMAEAVEICKLRLFLKLVSQVDSGRELEPLPDIDFNIRAGNTLVGYATEQQFKPPMETIASDYQHRDEIIASTADLADLFDRFREQQTLHGGKVTTDDKRKLRDKLSGLSLELDRYLAHDYGINPDKKNEFAAWRVSHQPFHWFAEFYGVMREGGFDVVIGNPPYVEYGSKLKEIYQVCKFKTEACGNLHAFVAERSLNLIPNEGRVGLIVPLPSINTGRMESLQSLIKPNTNLVGRGIWISAYDERPSGLFVGVDQRLVIEIIGSKSKAHNISTTGIQRWASKNRESLFPLLSYTEQDSYTRNLTRSILKIKDSAESNILQKFYTNNPIALFKSSRQSSEVLGYRTAGGRYWKVVLDRPFESGALSEKVCWLKGLTGSQAVSLISSSTFWWYYSCHFDMYNLKDYMIFGFRFSGATKKTLDSLDKLGKEVVDSLEENAAHKEIRSKSRGVVVQKQYVGSKSKDSINEVDLVLAQHYGFSVDELDFIVNYDIKFRMGSADDEE
jgi:hypothetical protein